MPDPTGVLTLPKVQQMKETLAKRDPDPEDVKTAKLTDPDLQVRGTWKEVRIPGAQPSARACAVTAVWRGMRPNFLNAVVTDIDLRLISVLLGKYYIWGGRRVRSMSNVGEFHDDDGWVLDLRNTGKGWSRVPRPPETPQFISSQRIIIYEDKGYLFQGIAMISTFDFVKGTWSKTASRFADGTSWASIFPVSFLGDFTSELNEHTAYVFGGQDSVNRAGHNLLLALNMKTFRWTILSGSTREAPNPLIPDPRATCMSWIFDDKLYICGGGSDRRKQTTDLNVYPMFHELWSWDIKKKAWTKERMAGNAPSPRSESGCTFNTKWNRAVIFGGYNNHTPRFNKAHRPSSDSEAFEGFEFFGYYGDTFVWNPETKRWSYVITRGFPTYRTRADMVTDQDTGRTFLTGGCTYMPCIVSKSQLCTKPRALL